MKCIIFCISWIGVFVIMDNHFHIENNVVYAVVGYSFHIFQDILDLIFDKPH